MVPQLEQLGSDETVLDEVLSHPRRRHILRILHEVDAPLALADLAGELHRLDQETSEAETDQEEIRRCQIVLYHNHVPKLADAGVVTFDTARLTPSLA